MLSRKSLKEILELVDESDGSFVILEKDEPRLAILDFNTYEGLVEKANTTQAAENILPQEINTEEKNTDTGKTILVTGGAGFLGSLVSKKLVSLGYKVVVFDNLSKGRKERLINNIEFIKGDLRDKQEIRNVFEKYDIDAVFHMAESSGHKESESFAEEFFINNIEGGLNLLKVMAEYDVRNVVYKSSRPVNSIYCRTKLLFEQILQFYHQSFSINSISLRIPCSVKKAEEEVVDTESLLIDNPIGAVLKTALGKINYLPVADMGNKSQDGSPEFELVSSEDAVSAFIFAFKHLQTSAGSMVYGIDAVRTTLNQLIEVGLEVTKKMIPTTRIQNSELWDEASEGSVRPLSSLDWRPEYTDLEKLVKEAWLMYSHQINNHKEEGVKETEPIHNYEEPVSLSELLSGKYTPFIKPHNS